MKNKIIKWFWGSADWWQFWLPGSGFIGGGILGLIACIILFIIFN